MKNIQLLLLLLVGFIGSIISQPHLKRRREDHKETVSSAEPGECEVERDVVLDVELRKFVVDLTTDETDLGKMLVEMLAAPDSPLSVTKYIQNKKYAAEIRLEMDAAFKDDSRIDKRTQNPINRTYVEKARKLQRASSEHAQEILRGFPADSKIVSFAGVIVIKVPRYGVVFKIPNPFYAYSSHERFLARGLGGENLSPYRQVNRVLTAKKINEKCTGSGLRAPCKSLYLRPGGEIDGPIDDAHAFICCELFQKMGDVNLSCLSDEMLEILRSVTEIIGAADFYKDNMWQVRCPGSARTEIVIIDTEKPCEATISDAREMFGMFDMFSMLKPGLLAKSPTLAEIAAGLTTQAQYLFVNLPEGISDEVKTEWLFSWISRYLFLLGERGGISEADRVKVEGRWRFCYQSRELLDAAECPTLFFR